MRKEPIKVVVCGAAGRMGKLLTGAVLDAPDMQLVGATEHPKHDDIDKDVGVVIGREPQSVWVTEYLGAVIHKDEVVLDFTEAGASLDHAEICSAAGVALVRGTTGFSLEGESRFEEYVAGIPCVRAPNYAVGVNLLFRLVEEAARILGDEYDVEIVEAHHRFKKDAPSGTAKRLGEATARGLKRNLEEVAVYGRKGMVGERTKQEIGIHAIRAGDIVGEHTVLFAATGERVELVSKITSRDAFVAGALRAVRWVVDQPAGLYDMGDVLGLK